jgi:hypothetical protein
VKNGELLQLAAGQFDILLRVDRRRGGHQDRRRVRARHHPGPARGEFVPNNHYWAAGRGGMLVEFNTTEERVHEYRLPTAYASL